MAESASVPANVIHVLAGVLCDVHGHVLLAQRPPDKHLAGLWEFPGGKSELGETPLATLARELQEELGILVQEASPLICVPWRYGERELQLDAWRVMRWQGQPQSMEGQGLQWREPGQVDPAMLTAADRPILEALKISLVVGRG